MTRWLPPPEFLPAILLTVAVTGVLGWLRYTPVAGEAVAAVYRPGASLPAMIGRLAEGWRVLGVAAERPLPVLLLRAAPGASAPADPPGAWLVLRAAGAGQCGQLPSQGT